MKRGRVLFAGVTLLALSAIASSGCQSTQATSAEREAAGKKLISEEEGLVVNQENPNVKVLGTTLLSDEGGTAVVVEVENTSGQAFANVPVLIDVRDAKGKTVFANDTPGLEPALTQIPLIGPGEKFAWVNDQVLPTGKPDSVKVKIGASEAGPVAGEIPQIEVDQPKLQTDQFSEVQASGQVLNESAVEQEDLTLFAVARDGGKVVAAGRAVLKRLQPNGEKAGTYHVFFVGDPKGADITVAAPPTVLK